MVDSLDRASPSKGDDTDSCIYVCTVQGLIVHGLGNKAA